jgi:hypothetical protein
LRNYDTNVDGREFVLVHIGNNPPSFAEPTERLNEFFGPIRAVLEARQGGVLYTLNQLDGVAHAAQNRGTYDDVLRIQMEKADVPIPLGWFLSSRAANAMAQQLSPVDDTDCSATSGVDNYCTLHRLGDRVTAPPL